MNSVLEKVIVRFAKGRIIEIFKKEVEMYSRVLVIPESDIISYISFYLHNPSALPEMKKQDEYKEVIEIFKQRVKFYAELQPVLTPIAIEEVVKEHLES